MESASDGQVAFFTHLHLPAQSGTKNMVVNIDPGAQVITTTLQCASKRDAGKTIPLSRYHALYPNKLTKSRYPKAKSLMPTHHTWISHDGSPKPFLGHFIVEVVHAKEPRMFPVRFYIFEDATNPHILLSHATLERLGIVSFQVMTERSHTCSNTPASCHGKRKTASLKGEDALTPAIPGPLAIPRKSR